MKRTITLRYLFTLCVMTLISAFCGGNLASAEEVTFVFPSDMSTSYGAYSFSSTPINVSLSNVKRNSYNSRIYMSDGSTVTVSCEYGYKITGVYYLGVLSGTFTCKEVSDGAVVNNSWTADASKTFTEVVFNNGYVRMSPNDNGFRITYEVDSSAPVAVTPTLKFSSRNPW